MKKVRILLLFALVAVAMLSSCVSYGYSLITHNETTAKIRDHEILGIVSMEIRATAELWNEDKGVRSLLLEEARSLYGDGVDDVVNVATSQAMAGGFSAVGYSSYIFIQGDAIRYVGGGS